MPVQFNQAQSFFVDPSLVQKATQVFITSIDLFCKSRPSPNNNQSGQQNPGVSVYIVPMVNGLPSMAPVPANQIAYLKYASVYPTIDASVASHFIFTSPIPVTTGQLYALVIVPDGNVDFEFWTAKVGDVNLKTGATISSMNFNGSYFQLSSDASTWNALAGTELTFKVNIARYSANGVPVAANNTTFTFVIGNYEFVTYDGINSTGQLMDGEMAYMTKASFDGTVQTQAGNNIILIANSFGNFYSNLDSMSIVIDNGNQVNVRKIVNFTSNKAMLTQAVTFSNSVANFYSSVPVGTVYMRIDAEVPTRRSVILSDTTANSAIHFANSCNVRTDTSNSLLVNCYFYNLIVSDIDPAANIVLPAATSYLPTEVTNYSTPDGQGTAIITQVDSFPAPMFVDTIIPNQPVILPSRSNEVTYQSNYFSFTNSLSSSLTFNLSSKNDFIQPSIHGGLTIPVYFTTYYINNDYTLENTMYGNAISKEISSTIILSSDQYAEDIISWLIAYRPIGTDFKVFAKLYNSADPDSFVDKDWTLLSINENSTTYSSLKNKSDFVEYSFRMLSCPNTDFTYSCFATLGSGQTNVVATSAVFGSNVAVGDLVKIYSPLFPNVDFIVASVTAITNTTQIVIDQSTTNNSIWGSGLLIDHIGFPKQAFLNNQNNNIVRYYDSNFAYHDTYDQFAIKIVFLSQTLTTLPYVSSSRAVAISA